MEIKTKKRRAGGYLNYWERGEREKNSSTEKRWTESDQTELTARPTGTPSVHLH